MTEIYGEVIYLSIFFHFFTLFLYKVCVQINQHTCRWTAWFTVTYSYVRIYLGCVQSLRSDCPQHEEKKGQLWIFFYLLKQLDIPVFDALHVISNWTRTELLHPWMYMWRRKKTNRSCTVRQSQQSFCPTAKGKKNIIIKT